MQINSLFIHKIGLIQIFMLAVNHASNFQLLQ